jgi:hypothetical protein
MSAPRDRAGIRGSGAILLMVLGIYCWFALLLVALGWFLRGWLS